MFTKYVFPFTETRFEQKSGAEAESKEVIETPNDEAKRDAFKVSDVGEGLQ